MSVAAEIEAFLVRDITAGRGIDSIERTENLLVRGIVDSHGLLQLATFLEERYGFSVADQDIVPNNFESVAAIEAYVERKLVGEAPNRGVPA